MNTNYKIRNQISLLLEDYREASNFIDILSKAGELLFFGGSIRDCYINKGFDSLPRDFDIAIKFHSELYESQGWFENLLKEYNYKKNRFGGFKVLINDIEFDIWDMKNTWAFKEKKIAPTEENLTKTVYLNVDGIVYNYNRDLLYYNELNESLLNKIIDIVLQENPQKKLNLLRAMIFKKKYDLNYSEKLINEFRELVLLEKQNLVSDFYKIQIAHYKEERLSKNDIKLELTSILI